MQSIAYTVRVRELSRMSKVKLANVWRLGAGRNTIWTRSPVETWNKDELINDILRVEFYDEDTPYRETGDIMSATDTLQLVKRQSVTGFDGSRYGLRFRGTDRVFQTPIDDDNPYTTLLKYADVPGAVLMFRTADGWVEA